MSSKKTNTLALPTPDKKEKHTENPTDLSRISHQVAWLRWRISQLFEMFYKNQYAENFNEECIKHLKALWAISTSITEQLKQYERNADSILNLDFMKYIHQSILYDFIYEQMGTDIGQTPEFYKQHAMKRLSKQTLSDILFAALAEGGYVANIIDVEHYLDIYLKNPPWNTTQYIDKKNIYLKTKSYFADVFVSKHS